MSEPNTHIIQPILIESQYLGSIHYYARIIAAKEVWIETAEHFVKSTYRNRCFIANPQGALSLSIPLSRGRGQRRSMQQIELAPDKKWLKLHWRSFADAYRSSPYFEYYEDYFYPLYHTPPTHLFSFNQALFNLILQLLQAEVKVHHTTQYHKTAPTGVQDWRSFFYIQTKKQGIDASFSPPKYEQVFEERTGFIPNLSIVDLLFNEGPASLQHLKKAIQTQK